MKKIAIPGILITFLFSVLTGGNQSFAQRPIRNQNQVAILGWTDDTHYLIRTFDADRNLVIQNVNINTGKGITVSPPKTDREILSELLPPGVIMETNDVISPDRNSVVLIKERDLYYFRKGDKEIRRITGDDSKKVNVCFSPEGTKIAYTKDKDLYVYDLVSNMEIRLTTDASERVYNGYSSWVYMEEILGRQSHYADFWFSPDGNKIAYLRTDETDVPIFTLNRLDEPDGVHGMLEQVPYPKAGDPNPKVRMGIADIGTAKTTWVKTDYN